MRRLVPLVGALLISACGSWAEASTHECRLGDHCYTCVEGTLLDDCYLDCEVCGGTRCVGPSSVPETENQGPPSTQPLQPLLRFPAGRLGEVIHPSVGMVYDWFWRWRDAPARASRAQGELDVAGEVKVDGTSRDFVLSVRQHGDAQLHVLRIDGFGLVELTVRPVPEGRNEVEFDAYPVGPGAPRSGFLRFGPP